MKTMTDMRIEMYNNKTFKWENRTSFYKENLHKAWKIEKFGIRIINSVTKPTLHTWEFKGIIKTWIVHIFPLNPSTTNTEK